MHSGKKEKVSGINTFWLSIKEELSNSQRYQEIECLIFFLREGTTKLSITDCDNLVRVGGVEVIQMTDGW